MPALLRYTLLRLGLLVLAAGLLLLLGLPPLVALLLGLLVSGAVSLFLLSGTRDEVAGSLAARTERVRRRMRERTAAEDAADDARRAEERESPGTR